MKPYLHQKKSLKKYLSSDIIFDTSDPGTGKTLPNLFAIKHYLKPGEKALVLCPKSIMMNVWYNEAKTLIPTLRIAVAYAENRAQAFAANADVYVTNHDAVKWLITQKPTFWKAFKILVIDESGAFKHHTSQRSKAAAKIAPYFMHRYLLNGTPFSNTITEVWHQAFLLDSGKRLGNSFYKFRDAVCTPERVGPNPNALKWTDKDGAENAVVALLKDVIVRNKFENCVSIPATHYYTREYLLTTKQALVYRVLARERVLALEKGTITAINAAAVATKLLQISAGAVYADGVASTIATDRAELVLDLIEERDQCVVFFLWEHIRDALVLEAGKRKGAFAVIDGSTSSKLREEHIANFQAGKIKAIFAHPQTAAHGITLTRGHTVIWFSPTYNYEHYKQGNARVVRTGQKRKTEIINIIASGTLEEQVMEICMGKKKNLTAMLEEVTETLK